MSSISRISPAEELAQFLARRPTPEEIAAFQLSEPALARAHDLMERNQAGTLTADESRELDRLVLLDDIIGLIQSQLPAQSHPERNPPAEPPSA